MTLKFKVYIIAEGGVNHNGKLNLGKKIINAAKFCGADAVKFQSYVSENLATKQAYKANYQIKNTKKPNETQYEMLKKLELNLIQLKKLKRYADKKNIDFLYSIFDHERIDSLLKEIKPKFIKIPSGEITNFLILEKLNYKKNKILLSTGMSNLKEIQNALNVLFKKKLYPLSIKKNKKVSSKNLLKFKKNVTVMHCVTNYPVEDKYANLNCVETLANDLNLNIGYSDHTSGILAPIIAASKGAKVIEKHLTLNKKMVGPDHISSLNPKEFKEMVKNIRKFEKMIGTGIKDIQKCEIDNLFVARKSIVAKRTIKTGEKFTYKNITVKRPGSVICASKIKLLIGLHSKKDYKFDDLIQEKI